MNSNKENDNKKGKNVFSSMLKPREFMNFLNYYAKKKPTIVETNYNDNTNDNDKSWVWNICRLSLLPISITQNYAMIFQKLVIFCYLVVLMVMLYYLIILFVLPTKTMDGMVFLYSLFYWVLFLSFVMFFFNHFTKNEKKTLLL